eukprot:Em0001g848a
MVGMSGKSSEPRGSSGNARRQQSSQSGPSSKPKPTAEALHLARILEGTSYPADMKDRIQQVAGVVPNKSEEEICVALHDHDYDPERAITHLLDADANQGEWTTSGRKGKKKGSSDTIVAPGDASGVAKTTGGTTRAASTRESYGGRVVVTRDGRDRGGRGRSNFGRGRNDKGGRGEKGDRPRQPGGKGSVGKWDEQSALPTTPSTTTTAVASEPQEETWDEPQPQVQQSSEEGWQQQQQEDSWAPQHSAIPEWEKPSVTPQDPVTWSEREELAPPIFPEALPTQTTASSTSVECVVSTSSPQCIPSSDGQDTGRVESEAKTKRSKQKRLARSLIPSKPVEMPVGMASIDAQFSTLGIDFVGARSHSPVDQMRPNTQQVETAGNIAFPNTRQSSDQCSIHQAPPPPPSQPSKDPAPPAPSFPLTTQPTLPHAHVLAALDPKPIATRAVPLNAQPVPGSGSGMGVAALPTKDVHTPVPPRETIAVHSEAPPSSVLTQPQTAEIVRPSNNTISFPDQSVRPSLQISSTPVLPASVSAMPLSSAVTMGNMQHASSAVAASHSSSAYVQQGLLQGGGVKAVTGAQAAVHANSQVVAAVHTSAQVAAHTSAQAAHTSAQAVHSAKLSQGPPGFQMYSQLMQPGYYMPTPGYYTTPDTVPRYQPAYYHQPGSTDPGMGGSGITRDHVTSGFAEQSKYAGKMGEGASPVVSSHQQQQQQGLQTQLGPAAYMNMGSYPQSHPFAGYFYPGAWYSAPAPPLPKPATNSFSGVGSAYQTHHGNLAGYEDVAAVSAHDYTKPYNAAPSALGKPDSDLSTFKQPYDSKPAGANAFNNYGLLQMPGSGVPMQMMAQQQHDGMQQSRGQQQQVRHSNKPTGYGGWPQSNS